MVSRKVPLDPLEGVVMSACDFASGVTDRSNAVTRKHPSLKDLIMGSFLVLG